MFIIMDGVVVLLTPGVLSFKGEQREREKRRELREDVTSFP